MSKTQTVTRRDAERVLAAVKRQGAAWIDSGGSEPTLVQDWDWSGTGPAPWAILWEEGPYDWTYLFPWGGIEEEFGFRVADVSDRIPGHVFAEAITSWALGIYPND